MQTSTAQPDNTSANTSVNRLALMGQSPAMERLRAQLSHIAPHFRSVLITGERGTGAAAVAHALRSMSPAPKQTLALASGAGQSSWIESDTLFIPEIRDMTPARQSVILPALKRGVRMIAATEHSAKTLVAAGHLRPDLYAALSTVEINLPPVRSRIEDVESLAQAVIGDRKMTPAFLSALQSYPWPGNLTELEEVLQEAMRLNGESEPILENLPDVLYSPQYARVLKLARLQDVVEQHVFTVLNACQGNKLRAAEILGISRSTLYRMLDSSPLQRAG